MQILPILACEELAHHNQVVGAAIVASVCTFLGCFAAFYAVRFGWRVLVRRPPMPACASTSDPLPG